MNVVYGEIIRIRPLFIYDGDFKIVRFAAGANKMIRGTGENIGSPIHRHDISAYMAT
ncbi:MAG: hypothetical protein LBI42_04525 [Chitinispirillales bacterium]|nr:hypothetical protein [Chitinispirillales bacterium]